MQAAHGSFRALTAQWDNVFNVVLDAGEIAHVMGEDTRQRVYSAEEVHHAGVEVDRRAKAYMADTGEPNYSVAMHQILEDDPELMAVFGQ